MTPRLPPPDLGRLEREVHERLARESASIAPPTAPLPAQSDLARRAAAHLRTLAPLLPPVEHEAVVHAVVARTTGLGPLEVLLADPAVREVLVNGGRDVWVERAGRLERTGVTLAAGEAERLLERILAPLGRRADRTSPVVDARLADGSRVHAVVPPVAVDGTCLAIRRFGTTPHPLGAFAGPEVVALLEWMVAAGWNVLVSGATSSGKTTLVNALAGALPAELRVVTIEDAAELRLPGEHVVRLEARPPTAEGVGGIDVRGLLRAALRLRPDRIVVGEVRGPEALDLLTALNTGHDGSLSTCHANSADDAVHRVEALALQAGGALPLDALRLHVQSALDAVVHVARLPDGRRRVVSVAELRPAAGGIVSHPRTRVLAHVDAVLALPARPPRTPGAPDAPLGAPAGAGERSPR
jgi:pilus assembly protein CpaF